MYRLDFLRACNFFYRVAFKPVLFQFDAEAVHDQVTHLGALLGRFSWSRAFLARLVSHDHRMLSQTTAGIVFSSPVGLAAGFDYEAQLYDILPAIGFGFGTIGTITRYPFDGNPPPRLGRLPKSKSLLVNKGLKNPGCHAVIDKLTNKEFSYPVGISIGLTNNACITSLVDAVDDICATFSFFESSDVRHAYYELNISCPNLSTAVSFYHPDSLRILLDRLALLNVKRPIFVKMPISVSDDVFCTLLDVILEFPIAGIIIGNLQKNRHDPSFASDEVARCGMGNFSGKPTWNRSNELIRLSYLYASGRLVVIGCGGVFSAEDAYTKIRLGASLVQLITGMVYEGPFLAAQIHLELPKLLHRDGYGHILKAVGVDV